MKGKRVIRYGSGRMAWLRTAAALRLRHWRGRGVHSPFAYAFVREVFMDRRRVPRRGPVYDALTAAGAPARVSAMVQAAYTYFHCNGGNLDGAPLPTAAGQTYECGMNIVFRTEDARSRPTNRTNETEIECFVSPLRDPLRYEACRRALALHNGMSIDCRCAVFIFHFKGLNREHIKL